MDTFQMFQPMCPGRVRHNLLECRHWQGRFQPSRGATRELKQRCFGVDVSIHAPLWLCPTPRGHCRTFIVLCGSHSAAHYSNTALQAPCCPLNPCASSSSGPSAHVFCSQALFRRSNRAAITQSQGWVRSRYRFLETGKWHVRIEDGGITVVSGRTQGR